MTVTALPTASRLVSDYLDESNVGLNFVQPRGTTVEVRRTTGWVPARTVRQGSHVQSAGGVVFDSELDQATAYTYAVFTKVGRAWVGPLALTAVTAEKQRLVERRVRQWLARNPWAMGHDLRADAVFLAPWRWPRHVPAAFELVL